MIEEIIVIGKIVLAIILYTLTIQVTIKLHDYLMIKKIRREAKSEN